MHYLPQHAHELLGNASVQLSSRNQRALELEDEYESNKLIKGNTSRKMDLRIQGSMPDGHNREPKSLGDQGAVSKPMATPSGSGYSYAHTSRTRFGDQQSNPYRKNQIQINYLEFLAARIPTPSSLHDELQIKEKLRLQLTKVAQQALGEYAHKYGYTLEPKAVDLKCFGSLRNGFMLPDTDLDLVVRTYASSFSKELEKDCPHVLEKAFLDAGFDAYLLSRTKAPVIKLCEIPSQGLLNTPQKDHGKRQQSLDAQLGFQIDSAYYAQYSSGISSQRIANLEFPQSGVGVRCNITFSGRLALYNTELLRCYALCDERVRLVGAFVKMWAKARKINDPYHGTMCSYGYILMVLHYLMNVVEPPLIPNLQAAQQSFSGHVENANVNGQNVSFFNDEYKLRTISKRNGVFGNQQSVGELLRGFFAYYGSRGSKSPKSGFHWVNNTISIRTQGGIISKHEKGWNTARNDNYGNRLRFLIAIEDPFEHEYNVATTVTEGGLNAIRAEFNRAQTIITRIQEIPGIGWEWRTDEGDVGQDFLAEASSQSNLHFCRLLRNAVSSTNARLKHLDCEPELCTARMEDTVARSAMPKSDPEGHSGVMPDFSSGNIQKKKPDLTGEPQSLRQVNLSTNPTADKGGQSAKEHSESQYNDTPDHTISTLSRRYKGNPSARLSMPSKEANSQVHGGRYLATIPSTRPRGVSLDSRQFHGPGTIRDRRTIFNNDFEKSESIAPYSEGVSAGIS